MVRTMLKRVVKRRPRRRPKFRQGRERGVQGRGAGPRFRDSGAGEPVRSGSSAHARTLDRTRVEAVHQALQTVKRRAHEAFDEKDDDYVDLMKTMRSSIRMSLGTTPFHMLTGGRTLVQTSAASVMQFSINTNNLLTMALNTTIVPELASISALFEEYKVAGIQCRYNPINPYNRGAVTVSVPIAMVFDDIDNALTITNSATGMAVLVARENEYHSFSPDHTWERRFMRRANLNSYDWTPFAGLGTEPSSFGALYVAGDGSNTASINYGALDYWFILELRMRS